jgi:hypothetical protein
MSRQKLSPIHPGEIPQEEFLGPLGISQSRVAKETSVSLAELMRSFEGRGRSPPMRPCASRGISGHQSGSG